MKMKRWVKQGVRSLVVLVGIIVLTSFTIDATDSLNDSQSALSILARKITDTGCPEGMIEMAYSGGVMCVDVYENSFNEDCPFQKPDSALEVQKNINEPECISVSTSGVHPAVNVTFHQAQNFCARRLGRLPSSYEWYAAALGTPDSEVCNLEGSLALTGKNEDCKSARGIFSMIGNAWEWVDGEVKNGKHEEALLPQTGYVAEADRSGVATETSNQPSELFNNDYFWSSLDGSMVMIRGGFYGSGPDGGVYSVHADIKPNFTSAAVGFRCVIDA